MNILSHLMADPAVAEAITAAVQADPLPMRRAEYVSAMKRMDWTFEGSDDQRIWRAGRDELQRMRIERAIVDPDGALWKLHAHPDYQHG